MEDFGRRPILIELDSDADSAVDTFDSNNLDPERGISPGDLLPTNLDTETNSEENGIPSEQVRLLFK